MNNHTTNVTSSSAVASNLIQGQYLYYVDTLIDASMLALLFYTTVLAMPQEMEYMWSSPKRFSLPNLFYALTRYGSLVCQAIVFSLDLVSPSSSLCNGLFHVQNAVITLTYTISAQGLLITRAYALCRGNRVVAGALAISSLGALSLEIYLEVMLSGCIQSPTPGLNLAPETLACDILTILTDLIAFCVCLWNVWGTWKLKRDIGIQSYNDLVSVLFRQAVSRFCFVITFTVAYTVLAEFCPITVTNILGSFQHSFSAILLADFTLDLRQQNSAAIRAANATLPTIEFQSVMHYIHESIVMEMGDHENAHTRESGDDPLGSPDVEIRREESA